MFPFFPILCTILITCTGTLVSFLSFPNVHGKRVEDINLNVDFQPLKVISPTASWSKQIDDNVTRSVSRIAAISWSVYIEKVQKSLSIVISVSKMHSYH